MSPHDNTNLADMHVLLQEWKDLHEMHELDHYELNIANYAKSTIASAAKVVVGKTGLTAEGQAQKKWLSVEVGDPGRKDIMKDLMNYILTMIDAQKNPMFHVADITALREALHSKTEKHNEKTIAAYFKDYSQGNDNDAKWKSVPDGIKRQIVRSFIDDINKWFDGDVNDTTVRCLKDALFHLPRIDAKWIELVKAYQPK